MRLLPATVERIDACAQSQFGLIIASAKSVSLSSLPTNRMSEGTIATELPPPHEGTHHQLCNVCGRKAHDGLVPFHELHTDLKSIVEANAPAMERLGQVCPHCVELFTRAKNQLHSPAAIFEQNSYVLPTPLRMEADTQFTGEGVTMAFLDSGFYAHADLTKPTNRIVGYHSIFDPGSDQTSLETVEVASWHGMMTSVVAAGNGYLSDGFYRGIAPDANVVLVKIGKSGHISEHD